MAKQGVLSSDWFEVKVGVRQGYLLSSTLFNIFLEISMDELYSTQHTHKLVPDMPTENRYTYYTTLTSAIFKNIYK